MANEEKTVAEAVASAIADAVGEGKIPLSLPTSSSRSAEVNAAYEEEIAAYRKNPVPACTHEAARKLLRRFARRDFRSFWDASVAEYLPAVSEGTMKLAERMMTHEEAFLYAKDLIKDLSPKTLARDFLYGVAHNVPFYRTALAAYFYIKNLPEHGFQKKYVGSTYGKNGEWEDRYRESKCEICQYDSALSHEPKMNFWYINIDMHKLYEVGTLSRSSLNEAILHIEEYKKLPRPAASPEDYAFFCRVLRVIEEAPEDTTSGKLRDILKKSGMLAMTKDGVAFFLDILGYLDILHPADSHGMVYRHTEERHMLDALSERTYANHPVNRWTRKCGIDYQTVSYLFDGIYE